MRNTSHNDCNASRPNATFRMPGSSHNFSPRTWFTHQYTHILYSPALYLSSLVCPYVVSTVWSPACSYSSPGHNIWRLLSPTRLIPLLTNVSTSTYIVARRFLNSHPNCSKYIELLLQKRNIAMVRRYARPPTIYGLPTVPGSRRQNNMEYSVLSTVNYSLVRVTIIDHDKRSRVEIFGAPTRGKRSPK